MTYFEIIEQDINGELSEEESILVKNRIKTQSQFANDYKLQLEIDEAISENEIMDLRENIQNIFNQKSTVKKGIIKELISFDSYLKPAIAAAITVVLVVASILLFNTSTNYTNDQLFTMNFESIPTISNTRSVSNNSNQLMNNAFQLYEQKQFNEAIVIFNKFESNTLSQFFLGISYIEINQYQNASIAFSEILNDNNNLFTEDSRWYLGLCYLKLDNTQKAKELFNKIVNSNSIYKSKAKKILKSL